MFEFIDQFDFLDALVVFGVINFVFSVFSLLLINKIWVQNNKNALLLGKLTQAVVDNCVLIKNETANLNTLITNLQENKQISYEQQDKALAKFTTQGQ